MFSFARGSPSSQEHPNEPNSQATPEQGNSEPTIQQRTGVAVTQFLASSPDHELAEDVDAWPEDAPRALLAPWEERLAENGHFDQLSYLFAEGTVFDTDDFRRLRPNPKLKKEWMMVQQVYRKGNPSRARSAVVSPDDLFDAGEEQRSSRSPRKAKRALEKSDDSDSEHPSKRAKGGRASKPKTKASPGGSTASVEADSSTEGGQRRLAVYDTGDENDVLSQRPIPEPSTEPSDNDEDSPGPRRGTARGRRGASRGRRVAQDEEDSASETDLYLSTESSESSEEITDNEEEEEDILQVEDTVSNVNTSGFVRRSGRSRSHPRYY